MFDFEKVVISFMWSLKLIPRLFRKEKIVFEIVVIKMIRTNGSRFYVKLIGSPYSLDPRLSQTERLVIFHRVTIKPQEITATAFAFPIILETVDRAVGTPAWVSFRH